MGNLTRWIVCIWFVSISVILGFEESFAIRASGDKTGFHVANAGRSDPSGLLVVIPGYGGSGERMLDSRWRGFAEKNGLVLLAPTFKAEGHENNHGKGYYYPEQGSGEVLEKAIAEAGKRYGVQTEKVLFFGFSAGAHVSHRFALWKPERVGAFVAYSAGWWSEPTEKMREVPALIMCGEEDIRYEPSLEFFKKGLDLGSPWIWRSYKDTGHKVTPAVRDMAEAFLAYHAARLSGLSKTDRKEPEPLYGDIQSYEVTGEEDEVAAEFRVVLPTKEIADVWRKEL